MFRSYFKTAIRTLLRNKGYTAINITGLTLGIAVCLTIQMIVRFESGFDNFHSKKDRIYRVITRYNGIQYSADGQSHSSGVPAPLSAVIKHDIPQFESSAGIFLAGNMHILTGADINRQKFRSDVFFTEPSFFDIFDFTWLAGSSATLNDPGTVVLSRETAEKYFGAWERAPGQILKLDNRYLLTVAGVIASTPVNTDFNFKIIAPYRLLDFSGSRDWYSINSSRQCYVLLQRDASVSSVNRQLEAFSRKYRHPSDSNTQALQPLAEVHHDSGARNFAGKTVSRAYIGTLELIGAFVLLIACVNFINLSTAQAINRAKEVGVRKVLGGRRSQLTLQFLLETLLLVAASVVLGVSAVTSTLNAVGKILDIPLSPHMLYAPPMLFFLPVAIVAVTLLAGFYPSLVLSAFNPIAVLKSSFIARRMRGVSLRRGLVVFQFVIAQALIIATLIILKQMKYFENRSMGFEKEALLNVPFPHDSAGIARIGYLHDQLSAVKGVQQVSFSNAAPADDDKWWTDFQFEGAAKAVDFSVAYKWIDANYLGTYKLSLVAGRNITATDSVREFLVNETLARKLGFAHPEDILNRKMNVWGGYARGPIVGVVKDFHPFSLKDGMAPLFMGNVRSAYQMAGIKLSSRDIPEAIVSIGKIWNALFPDYVFEYQFLDDKIDSFYKQERQLSRIYQVFAAVAIILSCLGLLGLASFMAVQRKKEVGIRKVLGATAGAIAYLLSKEFIFLTGIAFVIASSVTWYLMHRWLQNYAYHTGMGWWVFMAGGGASMIIALAIVGFHAVKAAVTNPVKSLRTE